MTARNYLPTLVAITKALCKFYDAHRMKIEAAVAASSLTSDQKSAVQAFLSGIDVGCAAIQLLDAPEGL